MPAYSYKIQLEGKDVVDPRRLRQEIERLNLPVDFDGLANSFRLSVGKDYGRGWVLLRRGDIDAIVKSKGKAGLSEVGHDLNLTFWDSLGGGVTLRKLAASEVEAVAGIEVSTPLDQVYLVKLVDPRYAAEYSALPTSDPQDDDHTHLYNCATKDHDASVYRRTKKDEQTLWTWKTMLEDLWSYLPDDMGDIDITSLSPPASNNPFNYDFQGHNAWDAINAVLEDIQHQIVPAGDGTFKIQPVNVSTPGLAAAITYAQQRLVTRAHDIGGKIFPGTVRVYFPAKTDAFQNGYADEQVAKEYWRSRAFHSEDIATTSKVSGAKTFPASVVALHDSLEALYDQDGVLTNQSALQTKAGEMAAKYLEAMAKDDRHDVFHGSHNFYPGGDLAGVAWYDFGAEGKGLETEIVYWPGRVNLDAEGGGISCSLGNIPSIQANEFPGACDQARQHLHTEYIAFVELNEILEHCNEEGERQAQILWGFYGGGSIEWSFTGIPHLIDIYEGQGVYYHKGERVMAYFHPQVRKWMPFPNGTRLYLLQAKACHYPGDSTQDNFNLFAWDGTEWVDTDEDVTAYDEYYHHMLLPEEYVWASVSEKYQEGCAERIRYQLIGSHGLSRMAKTAQAIAAGQSGSCVIWYHAGTSCSKTASSCVVNACNNWNGARDYYAGEEIFIAFFERRWQIIPTGGTVFHGIAQLAQDLCPGDLNALIGGFEAVGPPPALVPGIAWNLFNRAGITQDYVFLHYRTSNQTWVITDISHYGHDLIVDSQTADQHLRIVQSGSGDQDTCVLQDFELPQCAVMTCATPAWHDEISFKHIELLSDIYQEGLWIKGLLESIWVPCIGDTEVVDLIEGVDCAPVEATVASLVLTWSVPAVTAVAT